MSSDTTPTPPTPAPQADASVLAALTARVAATRQAAEARTASAPAKRRTGVTPCPWSYEEFLEHAREMVLDLGADTDPPKLKLKPRGFRTGKFGFWAGDKVETVINGKAGKDRKSVV